MAALLLCLVAGGPAAAQRERAAPTPPVAIEINARPFDEFRMDQPDLRAFGPLLFRGGLELTSSYRDFGGLSAIRVQADGASFISLTDRGRWFTGRIVYNGRRPARIADARMAPMLGPDGKTLASHGWFDTESIAQDDGTLYVGIERVNRIVRFDFGRDGLVARAEPIATPPGVATLPNNLGLEAMVMVPAGQPLAGTLIAISESGRDSAGNIKAFLIGGPSPGSFTVRRTDDFDISDCALLPGGDLLILERKFSWSAGVAIRLRRIAAASLAPGALVDGPALLTADMAYQVDNMEGLSVHRTEDGETVLTLVSDDNFSLLQRTLLLQFTLREE